MRTDASVSTWSSTTRIVRPVGVTCLRPVIEGSSVPWSGGPRPLQVPRRIAAAARAAVRRHKYDARCAVPGTCPRTPARLLGPTRTAAAPPCDDLLTLRQAHDCE